MIESTNLTPEQLNNTEQLHSLAVRLGIQNLHFHCDTATGLTAIVAIHSTLLGPALGGCRCIEYQSFGAAVVDAMRLARGMTNKAAIAGIPHGGGKAVLVKPPYIKDRQAYFKAFGRFIDTLGGNYITAKDSGTTVADMDVIATETSFVTSTSPSSGDNGDPSPYTALGVMHGIKAAVHHLTQKSALSGMKVAIQGVGYVGYHLAEYLHQAGAELIVCDTDQSATLRAAEQFNATVVPPDAIYDVSCDIFAPCALGAILNDDTIARLQCQIIAGSANNQLAEHHHGEILRQRGLLYVPDYAINSGGLIQAATYYNSRSIKAVEEKIANIYPLVEEILQRAEQSETATNIIAGRIAQERLDAAEGLQSAKP